MRPQKESSPHELYLRAASAAKPMAPLKLYANIIGKFMVERQLGAKVTDKVRQQTMVAKQQHMERQAILLDKPPIPVPGTKNGKRKAPGSGTVIKKTPALEHLRVASSSAVASRKASPLLHNTPSTKANADVRRRLVHCLAISPRMAEDAVKMVGGTGVGGAARNDLLALLEEVSPTLTIYYFLMPTHHKVAEQPPARRSDGSPRPWALKPQTWTEVRPFEWPKLTESERVAMARQARMAFKALKIPESDPAWDNVRYRATAPAIPTSVPAPPSIATASSSRSSTSAQAETKRSVTSTKEGKLKSKQDTSRTKGEIQVKDESSSATIARANGIKRTEADRPSTPSDSSSGTKTAISRRLPGSGYQAKKSPLPSTTVVEKSGTADPRTAPKPSVSTSLPQKPPPTAPPPGGTHARKTIPTIPPKTAKKEDESDRERDREYERQREREREKRAREKEKQREEREREQERAEMEKREKARQKEREEKRQREKEREREEMEQERRSREKERILKERATASAVPTFKRKTPTQEEDILDDASSKSSVPKRRKLDDGSSVASSSKARNVGLPKKPVHEPSPVPRLKMKKDSSPLPLSQERRVAGGPMHKSKASGSTKPRRRSPIYTSSSDEGEIPQPRKRNPSPPPVSDRSISSDQPSTERAPRHHRVTRTAHPLPTDHAALRALYQAQYTNYLGAFSKVVAQKRKIEAILNGDSEAEMDVMDPDELLRLSHEHMSLKTELERIQEIYTKGTSAGVVAGSTSD